MAETTGTARQEAERLVATVLAMASQAGSGRAAKDRDRDPAAAPGLTDMISGLVGQFLGETRDDPHPTRHQHRDPDDNADRTSTGPRGDARAGAGTPDPDADGDDLRSADRRSTDPQDSTRHSADRQDAGPRDSAWHGADRHSRTTAGQGHARQGAGQQLWKVLGGLGGWSTGSAECCVCPICRAIAGVRDPSPEQAERLATGAGDFASGVASLLRAVSAVTGTTGGSIRRKPPARPTTTPDQAWSAATRRAKPADSTPPAREVREGDDPWTAATRAPRPQPPETPPARAAGPTNATTRTAAGQAATQTDATGPHAPGTGPHAPGTGAAGTDAAGTGTHAAAAGATGAHGSDTHGPGTHGSGAGATGGEPTRSEATPTDETATPPLWKSGDPGAAATRAARPSTRPRAGAAGTSRSAGESGHTVPGGGGPGPASTRQNPRRDSAPDTGPAASGSAQATRQAAAQSDAAGTETAQPDAAGTETSPAPTEPPSAEASAWIVTVAGSVSAPAGTRPDAPSTVPDAAPPTTEPTQAANQAAAQTDAAGLTDAADWSATDLAAAVADRAAAAWSAADWSATDLAAADADRAAAAWSAADRAATRAATDLAAAAADRAAADRAAAAADGPAADRTTAALPQSDPWAAATRTPKRPAPAKDPRQAAPTAEPTRPATTAAAQPTADRTGTAGPDPRRDPAAAVEEAGARTGKNPHNPPPRVTGATDVWPAATAANGDRAGDTGVAEKPSVDHDVPGTAPTASAAEDRGAGSGNAARSGEAV